MTEPTSEAEKREELREKIEAGERRNEERSLADYARDARDGATEFVKDHPIATVAGGLALGIIIAAIVPGPGRRLAKQTGARASALATLGAELAMAYGSGLLDTAGDVARKSGDRMEDFGDSIGKTARGIRRDAAYYADSATDSALTLSRRAGRKASRGVRDARARVTS